MPPCLVSKCLRDRALPVQIEAASSLRYLIELDEAEEPVLAVLPDILNEYFRIMQEIGLDEVMCHCCRMFKIPFTIPYIIEQVLFSVLLLYGVLDSVHRSVHY